MRCLAAKCYCSYLLGLLLRLLYFVAYLVQRLSKFFSRPIHSFPWWDYEGKIVLVEWLYFSSFKCKLLCQLGFVHTNSTITKDHIAGQTGDVPASSPLRRTLFLDESSYANWCEGKTSELRNDIPYQYSESVQSRLSSSTEAWTYQTRNPLKLPQRSNSWQLNSPNTDICGLVLSFVSFLEAMNYFILWICQE